MLPRRFFEMPDTDEIAIPDSGALGITARHLASDKVRIIKTDKVIEQPLILVTKGKPSHSVANVIEAVRTAAKDMAGNSPVRSSKNN